MMSQHKVNQPLRIALIRAVCTVLFVSSLSTFAMAEAVIQTSGAAQPALSEQASPEAMEAEGATLVYASDTALRNVAPEDRLARAIRRKR